MHIHDTRDGWQRRGRFLYVCSRHQPKTYDRKLAHVRGKSTNNVYSIISALITFRHFCIIKSDISELSGNSFMVIITTWILIWTLLKGHKEMVVFGQQVRSPSEQQWQQPLIQKHKRCCITGKVLFTLVTSSRFYLISMTTCHLTSSMWPLLLLQLAAILDTMHRILKHAITNDMDAKPCDHSINAFEWFAGEMWHLISEPHQRGEEEPW